MPSQQDLMSALRQADAAGDTAGAQRIAAMLKSGGSSDGAIAGEPDLGGAGNSLLAGGIGFVHNLPFIGDAAITAGRGINDAANGRGFNWQQANDEARQTIASAAGQHPVASTVGGLGGAVDSAVIGGAALKGAAAATEGVPVIGRGMAAIAAATQLRKGQAVANAARLAAAGGAAGYAQGAGEQLARNPLDPAAAATSPTALTDAAVGAVAAPVGGMATGALASAAGGVASRVIGGSAAALDAKTASVLGKVYGENPSDLQALWQSHVDETGRAPSMAELTAYSKAGVVRDFAKNSDTISDALNARVASAAQERSANMQADIRPSPPTAPQNGQAALPPQGGGGNSPEEIANANTAQGDIDYPAARAHNFNISTAESDELGGISPADHMASQIVPLAGLKTADRVRIVNGLQKGVLSGQDAQLISSGLKAAQGGGSNYSPAIASAQGDLNDFLHGPGNDAASGALDQANANYASNAQRQAGAEHGGSILGVATPEDYAATAASKQNTNPNFGPGMQGGARVKLAAAASTPQGAIGLAQRLATDDGLYQKLSTTFGSDTAAALRRAGEAEAGSAKAMVSTVAPTAAAQDTALKDIAQIGAAVATHGITWKMYHAAKVFTGLSMPQAVQEKVAQYLVDPKMAPAGFKLLAKAGASAQRLRQIVLTGAAASGMLGADAANGSMENSQ